MSNEHFDFHLPKRKWVLYFSNQQMILICLSSPAVFRTNTLFPCHARIITADLAMEVYNTWWKLSVSITILNGTSSAVAGAPKKYIFQWEMRHCLLTLKQTRQKITQHFIHLWRNRTVHCFVTLKEKSTKEECVCKSGTSMWKIFDSELSPLGWTSWRRYVQLIKNSSQV